MLSDLPASEKPRERLLKYGPEALAVAELLAIILRTGRRGFSALELGHQLVAQFGLTGLARASAQELTGVSGCGPVKAVQIKAGVELGRRLAVPSPCRVREITSPADAARILSPDMSLLEQEHLRVMLLSTRNHMVSVHEVYKGSVNSSQVRVAEVFREAVRCNCPTIILAHNHPSGDPAPSPEDVFVTRQVVEAGQLLDIDVLDHLIIGRHGWVSLREKGLGFH